MKQNLKSHKTRNAFVASLMAVILCVAMLVGTTFAWFTDSVTSGKNTITAGNLDIEVYHTSKNQTSEEKIDGQTDLFKDVTLWEPGAVSYENITIKNVGTLAAKYKFNLNVAGKNTMTTDNVAHDLAEVIKVAVVAGGFTGTREDAQAIGGYVSLADFQKSGTLVANTGADTYGIVLYWAPTENDNLYNVNNGKTTSDGKDYLYIDFGINVVATQQTAEEDSFDEQYDKDAIYPVLATPVNSSESKDANVDAEDKTTSDITFTSGTTVPEKTLLYTDTEKENKLTTVAIEGKLKENITSSGNSDSTTFEINYTYVNGDTETEIHGFSEALTHTFNLSKNLKDVAVTHSGTAMTKVASSPTDGQYSYDAATGVLTVVSSTYSPFVVTYKSDFVAAIDGQGYATLEEAVTAAKNASCTITLLDDVDLTQYTQKEGTLEAGYVFDLTNDTLDLNGHTITAKNHGVDYSADGNGCTIKNGTFICKDNGSYALCLSYSEGKITIEKIITQGGINVHDCDDVVISESNCTGTNYYAVWAEYGSNVVINSGIYTSKSTVGNAVFDTSNNHTCSITINGGTITADGDNVVIARNDVKFATTSTATCNKNPGDEFVDKPYGFVENEGVYTVAKVYNWKVTYTVEGGTSNFATQADAVSYKASNPENCYVDGSKVPLYTDTTYKTKAGSCISISDNTTYYRNGSATTAAAMFDDISTSSGWGTYGISNGYIFKKVESSTVTEYFKTESEADTCVSQHSGATKEAV